MSRGYGRSWLFLLACAGFGAFWVAEGGALWRKRFWSPISPRESARRSSRFVAVAFPRVTAGRERFSISSGDLERVLERLKEAGYTTVGLRDVSDFYGRGRPLPRLSILLALDRDDPESVRLADKVLRALRLRAVVFVNKTGSSDGELHRHALSPHAVHQMVKGGAWDFGWFAETPPPTSPEGAVLDYDGRREWTRDAKRYPFRFVAARTGYNDQRQRLGELRVLLLRGDQDPDETFAAVQANWPRREEFVDEFSSGTLGRDWAVGWGVISATQRRLAILPTPRQSGADVLLNGTDDWRDLELEFELKKYRRDFWAYMRSKEPDHYVRVGLRNGYWSVQQKIDSASPPATLARSSEPVSGLPARVRIVLKNEWIIVSVDGISKLGKPLAVHPNVDHGRLEFGVYDRQARRAMALLTYVRAGPLPERWIAVRRTGMADDYDAIAQRIHDEAVSATAISPHWLTIGPSGEVTTEGGQQELIRWVAGYNRCLLVPMAYVGYAKFGLLSDPSLAARLAEGLLEAAQKMDSAGLNLRLPADERTRRLAFPFLAALRGRLKAQNRRLWLTLEGPGAGDERWFGVADGVLRPSRRPVGGAEFLEAVDREELAELAKAE